MYFILYHVDVVMIVPYGTVKPRIQALYRGDSTVLYCSSLTPVTWTKNETVLQIKSNTLVENSLDLNYVREKDSGNYTCQGTFNVHGQIFKTSSQLLVGGK